MKKTLLIFMLCVSTGVFAAVTNFPGEDAIIKQDRQDAQAKKRAAEKAELNHKKQDKNPLLEDAKPANYGEHIDLSKNTSLPSHYLNSQEVTFHVAYDKESKTFRFEMFKPNGTALGIDDFKTLPTGNVLESYWINSSLSDFEQNNFMPNEQAYVYNVKPKKTKGKCEAFYVRYQLRGDSDVTTRALILGRESESVPVMPSNCKTIDEDFLDTVSFTKSAYTAGFNWNGSAFYTNKLVKYTTFFTKEGIETFPDNIQSYAVSRDFSHFYRMNQKLDNRGPFYGVQFSQNIEYPGVYLFVTLFNDEHGKLQKLTAKNQIFSGKSDNREVIELY